MNISRQLFRLCLVFVWACQGFFPLLCAEEPNSSFSYRGWEGALHAANEALEIVVLPQTGRLLHLSTPGKENLLNFEAGWVGQLPPAEEGDWLNYGGDWMWAVHQDSWEKMGGVRWPPLRVLDRAMWHSEVEVDGDGTTHIRLRRDLGAPVYVQVERHFELAAGKDAELRVHQSIRRIQASDVPVTLWQISQVLGAEQVIMGSDPEDFEGKGYRHIDFNPAGEEVLSRCDDALVYKALRGGEHKLGTAGNWIAARKENQALLIWAEGGRGGGTLPDQGCAVVMYSNSGLGYSEIETQSEEVALAPGETLQNTVVYSLVDLEPGVDDCSLTKQLRLMPPVSEVVTFMPRNAHPGDQLELRVRTNEEGGVLHWGVNSPSGNWELPDPVYWPEGTVVAENGKAVETPLPPAVDGYAVVKMGPFDRKEQLVTSVHTVVRWENKWESKNGENYNLILQSHPDAVALQWVNPEDPAPAGWIKLAVASDPVADEIRAFLHGTEIAEASGSPLSIELNAREWTYGPHDLKIRALKSGHLSTVTKRIWKLPTLDKMGEVSTGTPYGASKTEEGTWQVVLYAPHAKFVEVEWQVDQGEISRALMSPSSDGHWVFSFAQELQDAFAYRYLVNGEMFFADPWSQDVRWETPAGTPSHLPEHAWSLVGHLPEPPGPWKAPDPATWVIYELHIPDVAPPGSYQGLKDKLDYIESLGVNMIEPLPITAFPGAESWGYNPAYHMAIERSYGPPEAFKALLLSARERGIGYIADLVLNHVDANAPLNRLFGEPEVNPYTMPFPEFNWGFPKLDQQDPALKRYIKDSLEHWVNYWGVDGFRYDATQWVKWSGYKDWGASWMSYVVAQANPDVVQIAENLPSEPAMVKGTELNAEWDGHYRWRMRKVFTEAVIEEPEKMAEILDPRNHDYQSGFQRVPYIESHDEERFMRELLEKGYSAGDAFTRHHAAAAVTLTVPGRPMLYAGQEWGEMTLKNVGNNPLQWQLREQPARSEMLGKFKELIDLRVSHRALHHDRIDLLHLDAKHGTIAYLRPGIPESILVAFNVSKEGAVLRLPVEGEVVAEVHQQELAVDLNKLTLRPGQARIFRIHHEQELR